MRPKLKKPHPKSLSRGEGLVFALGGRKKISEIHCFFAQIEQKNKHQGVMRLPLLWSGLG
jgi:hypothetical protein